MSELRLYLYRKAGREVWDAEMWLPDGRRRVWRTGIVDKSAAMVAARARLEALASLQTAASAKGERSVHGIAQALSTGASERDADLSPGQVAEPAIATMDAPACAGWRPFAQAASAGAVGALASEGRSLALQTAEEARKKGALSRFDRCFFGDLASLWRARA